MKPLLNDLEIWIQNGHTIALATLVHTQGSSPRETGAVMAVNEKGKVIGSISGGCVEAAVVEESLEVITERKPRLVTYGIADELGFEVGLTCGGTIQVFVQPLSLPDNFPSLPLSRIFQVLREPSIVLGTIIQGQQMGQQFLVNSDQQEGIFGSDAFKEKVIQDAQAILGQEKTAICHYRLSENQSSSQVTVFFQSFAPELRMIIFGAVDFCRTLCQLAKFLGYHVTICDARSALATAERFPEADAVMATSPKQYLQKIEVTERTVIAVLTHDPKFDVPILTAAVKTQAGYIGAMGSRQATQDRRKRLQAAGLTLGEIDRIHAPIGLDLGARNPQETAVSIMAEIIADSNGRWGEPLSSNKNAIHSTRMNRLGSSEVIPIC